MTGTPYSSCRKSLCFTDMLYMPDGIQRIHEFLQQRFIVVDESIRFLHFFWGGCNGNLQGISRLVKGMKVEEVLQKLEGVKCGNRSTSCPDQLCKALREMKQ